MREITPDESKRLQLEMLSAFHEFCETHHLRYYLYFGTLLGAVRHKGFIPWDDDIDIAIYRKDYEYLRDHFRHDYFIVNDCEIDRDYYHPMGKMIDTRTELIEPVDWKKSIGVYIDLFVLYAYSDDERRNRRCVRKELFLRNLYSTKVMPGSKKRRGVKRVLHPVLYRLLHRLDLNRVSRVMNSTAKALCIGDAGDASEYGVLANGVAYTLVMRFKSEWLKERVRLPFENGSYYVPAKYHEVLTCLYGDYMKLPPEDQRVTHHLYRQYWKE